MKILSGFPWKLNWEISGLGKRLFEQFRAISNIGIEVELYCLGPRFSKPNFSTIVPRVETTVGDNPFIPLLNSAAFSNMFAKFVKNRKYDALQCFNSTTFFIKDQKYLFQTVNPTYAFVQDILKKEYPNLEKYRRKIAYYEAIARLEKDEYEKAYHIVASSEIAKENIARYHEIEKTKITVIPAGVSPEEVNPRKKRSGEMKVVLFPGTVSIMKGFPYVAKAMLKVHEELPKTILIAAGRINKFELNLFKKMIKDLKNQKILTLAGFLPRKKLFKYYQMSDVCCLPSLFDDMNMSILESVACGLPIVATPNTGFPEINKVGIEVPHGNSEAIAEALLTLLTDPDLAYKKSDNAHKLIQNYFWNRIALKFRKVYENIMN
jgi:glycosyltransferase involved in cell wall biosynthesis